MSWTENRFTASHAGGTTSADIVPSSGPSSVIALTAGTYEFEAFIRLQCSSTGGVNLGGAYSGTVSSFVQEATGEGAANTAAHQANHASGLGATAFAAQATTDVLVHLHGIFVATGSGNFSIKAARVTSPQTWTVQANSVVRVRQIA
jgi:hypothetical protein